MKKEIQKASCWVSYINPFCLIVKDNEEVPKFTLEEINNITYDHGKLCRIIDKVEVANFPYSMIISGDGALAIPQIGKYKTKESAVQFFNLAFCKLLLGGIFCEAIDRRDVVIGSLHNDYCIWPVGYGNGASSNFHSKLRMRTISNFETIVLSNPNHYSISKIKQALEQGGEILKSIKNLSPTFLIRGITELKYRNWDLVLSNLWITIEQLIDHIWHKHFINNQKLQPENQIDGRLKSFKDDNRTWSTSVKQELLFQSKILSEQTLKYLHPARKARNKLVHEGRAVSAEVAQNLFLVVVKLISNLSNTDTLASLDLEKNSYEEYSDIRNIPEDNFSTWNE